MATITAKRILVIDEDDIRSAQLCLETIANWEVLELVQAVRLALAFAEQRTLSS